MCSSNGADAHIIHAFCRAAYSVPRRRHWHERLLPVGTFQRYVSAQWRHPNGACAVRPDAVRTLCFRTSRGHRLRRRRSDLFRPEMLRQDTLCRLCRRSGTAEAGTLFQGFHFLPGSQVHLPIRYLAHFSVSMFLIFVRLVPFLQNLCTFYSATASARTFFTSLESRCLQTFVYFMFLS